jgi:hypothetical protein
MTSPKRPDVTGSPEQAFGYGKKVLDYLIGGIKAESVAAIVYIAPNGHLQALYAPQLHTSIDGTPISIVGNASGKLNEFSMVELVLDQLGLVPCFYRTDSFAPLDGISIATALLSNSRWKTGTLFGTALPNFVIIYFGHKAPTGKIWTDDTKHELALLGPGYELWGKLMSKAAQHEADASIVMDAAASAKDVTYAGYYTPTSVPSQAFCHPGTAHPLTPTQSIRTALRARPRTSANYSWRRHRQRSLHRHRVTPSSRSCIQVTRARKKRHQKV